jgi:hypothetical protein
MSIKEKFLVALFIILCVLGGYVAQVRSLRIKDEVQKCEAAGYTWLSREAKCIEVKEFKFK